jgi:23S rRNA pseudouridine1911/1915/1917 synthase
MTEQIEVLFEDAHVLAVAKPAGLLIQGTGAGETTLEDRIRAYLRPAGPAEVYLGTVHRLDRPVSGVTLWAKTTKAARRLSASFSAHEAEKEYWAVVESDPLGIDPEGVWTDWITGSVDRTGVVRSARPDEPGARQAVTRYKAEAGAAPFGTTWLRLWPETGRTHQLRVQTSMRRSPVWGDTLYGSLRPFAPGIALHARSLSVLHPILHTPISVLAPIPASWKEHGISLAALP